MANPWDVLPTEPHGDESFSPIYHAVGLSLSHWESLETQQGMLFSIIAAGGSAAAQAAYGTIVSSTGRTEMILAAAGAIPDLGESLYGELKTLMTAVGNLAGRRNEIAHGIATGFKINDWDRGFYLVPNTFNTKKRQSFRSPGILFSAELSDYKYAYTSAQILKYADHFIAQMKKIFDFNLKMAEARAPKAWRE